MKYLTPAVTGVFLIRVSYPYDCSFLTAFFITVFSSNSARLIVLDYYHNMSFTMHR